MSSIVYWTDKRNGHVYAYSSESYWDKAKKAPRSKRTYLGRVDLETGDIIKGGRKAKAQAAEVRNKSVEEIEDDVVRELKTEIVGLEAKISELESTIKELRSNYQQTLKAVRSAISALETIDP